MSAQRPDERTDAPRAADWLPTLDGVLLATVAGGAVTLEAANEGARALLGIADDEPLPGPAVSDADWPPRARPLGQRLRLAAERGRATREQLVQRGPNGERIDVEVQLEPLPADDGGTRVMAVLRVLPRKASPARAAGDTAIASVGVFRTERGLGAVFVDDALLELLGLTHEQALGRGWLDAIHPDEREGVQQAITASVEREEAIGVECRILRDGVDERWARIRAVPMRGDDGRVTGCLGSIEDITEARNAQLAGARLAELAEAAQEIIGIVDPDWRIVYVNAAGRNRLGIAGDDSFMSVPATEFLAHDAQPNIAREIAAALQRSGVWSGSMRLRTPDGRELDVEATILRHSAPGEADYYSFLGRDVTDVRRIEHALHESEDRFRVIADASPTAIYYVGRDGTLEYVNARFVEIFDQPEHALIGFDVVRFIHPDDFDRFDEARREAAETRGEFHAEFRIRRPDDQVRWLRAHGAPVLDRDGELVGYVGSIDDETEEQLARQALLRLQRTIETTTDLVTFHDLEGRMFYGNAAARRFYGSAPDEPIPPLGPDDFLGERAAEVVEEIRPAVLAGETWSGEVDIYGANDAHLRTSLVIVPHHNAQGELEYVSALARDVSERHIAEQRLSAGVAWFRSIVQHAPDLLAVLDADANVMYISPSVERLLGFEREQALRDGLGRPDDPAATLIARALATPPGEVAAIEGTLQHRDGSIRFYEGSATNLLDDPVVGGVVLNAHDVTDRREAEQARRRSEVALRAIVQSSPLAIFALDKRGVVHVWNHACEAMFGWAARDVIGKPPPFEGGDLPLDTVLQQAFAGETVTGCEGRVPRADGTVVDVDVAIAPLRDGSGRVVTAVVVAADVTEQKHAAQALQESERRFRSLVQHSSDMLAVLDGDGAFRYVSPSAAAFLGRDADDVVGSPPHEDLIHPDDMPAVTAAFERVRSKPGGTETFTLRMRRGDGTLRWVEMIAVNRLDDPAVAGIVTNSRDITDRVEAEAAIRASEERLQALVASASDVIAVIDAEGKLQYSSAVAEHVFGYPQGAGYGEEIFGLVHPDDRDRMVSLFERTREIRGMFPPVELRLRRADGSWMHAEILANNLLDEPAVQGIVITARDITERKISEEALRASERRLREGEAHYRAVVDDQTELVCRYLPDTTLTFANRAFAEFYGHDPEQLVGTKLVDLFPASERSAAMDRLRRFGPGHEVQTDEDWEYAADGSVHWFQWTDRAFLDENGNVIEFQSVGRDITDKRRAAVLTAHQAEILEQVARGEPLDETLATIARTVEDHFPKVVCAISLLDDDGMTLRIGAAPSLPDPLRRALDGLRIGPANCSPGTAAFRREPVAVADVTEDPLWADLRDVAAGQGIRAAWSTPIFASDGHAVLGTLDAYLRTPELPDDEHNQIVLLLAHLASIAIERKAFEERLAHQSMHDPLTGLPNRLLFLDRLTLAIARCRRVQSQIAVLFLDLDRFKNVNDSVGHDAGDELLIAVARRLESVLRPGDTVARFGGDEFTVLCEDLTTSGARERAIEIAQRLLNAVSQPFIVRGTETFVSASIGIALATGDERPEELMRDADAAMYHAKESGRGRVEVFDDTMRARALARHATENALHRALERGELVVFFQPVVSLTEARVIGAEALVRWQHPERGLVSPGEFVPLAEETGLVVALGTWVLEHAAREAALWQLESDEPFIVSVNLSARQLAQPDLAERISGIIEHTGVEPHNLCLEITESVLMDDAEGVIRVIERVRALGVRLAIDDFGTGYSSLGYLKRFPVDTVKIDRSFVDGLGSDPGDAAIVSAVIGLAHALELRVVAEGVETEEQLSELLSLGCDAAQGYFFAPPQPVQDLRSLIGRARNWRPPGARLMNVAQRASLRRDRDA